MSVDRYGVTHDNRWRLMILVALIGVTVGTLGGFLAWGKGGMENATAAHVECNEALGRCYADVDACRASR